MNWPQQIGIVTAIVIAGTAALVTQNKTNNRLRAELAGLQQRSRELARLSSDLARLRRDLTEIAVLRQDDAELLRLRDEAASVSARRTADAKATATQQLNAARPALARLLARYGNGHPAVTAARNRILTLEKSLGLPPTNFSVYEAGAIDVAPQVKGAKPPVYPVELRQSGVPGEVHVALALGAQGEVIDAVAEKSTQTEFEAAAVEAAKNWKFAPGMKSGAPVNVRVLLPIVFTTRVDSDQPAWF